MESGDTDSHVTPPPPPHGPRPSSPTASVPADSLSADRANIRVTYLLTGNPRPPQSLGALSLTTTVGDLRDRIQHELPEHPSPAEQRLIYQGRPLLRNEATLRDVLRIEPGAVPGPLPYTIHIVVNARSPAHSAPPTRPAAATVTVTDPGAAVNASTNANTALEASADGLQESLSRISQQIEANRADLHHVQHRIAIQHNQLGALPHGQPVGTALHNGPPPPLAFHHPPVPQAPANFVPGQAHLPGVPQGMDLQQQIRHLQTQSQQMLQHLQNHAHLHAHYHTPAPAPTQPSSQQPHATPSDAPTPLPTVQHFTGPNGQRQTIVTGRVNLAMPMPMQRPASAPGQVPAADRELPRAHTPGAPPSLAPPTRVQLASNPTHLPFPLSQNRVSSPLQRQTTAWILSSPTGPQALLFAPGHGYFSSNQPDGQAGTRPTATQTQAPQGTIANAGNAPQDPQPAPRQGDPDVAHLNRDLVRIQQRRPPAQPAAQGQNEPNDLFAFVIQRGWLFLRLYMFMYVFSEPGTWKRWLMIIVATIICLQPRDGPLTRVLAAARQHLDALIGPPAHLPGQPPPAAVGNEQRGPVGAAPPQPVATGPNAPRPANVRGALQMTPEEAAARLMAEQQQQRAQQPPNMWRDIFHRIEQSLALFLASLIPGVGERHVQARAEARREAQRLADERRAAAEEEAARLSERTGDVAESVETPGDDNSAGKERGLDSPPDPVATSSSVEDRASGTDLRRARRREGPDNDT